MVGYKWATSVGRYWGAAADHLIITTAQMWPGGRLPHLPATRQCSNPPEAAWATDRKWAGGGGSVAQWMVPYGGAGLDTAVYLLIYRDNSGGTSLHHHQPPYHHCQHTLIIITHNITIMGRFGKQFHIQTLNNNWNGHYVSTYNIYWGPHCISPCVPWAFIADISERAWAHIQKILSTDYILYLAWWWWVVSAVCP